MFRNRSRPYSTTVEASDEQSETTTILQDIGIALRAFLCYFYFALLVISLTIFFGCIDEISRNLRGSPKGLSYRHYMLYIAQCSTAVSTGIVFYIIYTLAVYFPRRFSPLHYAPPVVAVVVGVLSIPWMVISSNVAPAVVALVLATLQLLIWVRMFRRASVDTDIARHATRRVLNQPQLQACGFLVTLFFGALVTMLVLTRSAAELKIVSPYAGTSSESVIRCFVHVMLWVVGFWTWMWMRAFLHVVSSGTLASEDRLLFESAGSSSKFVGTLAGRGRAFATGLRLVPTCILHSPRVILASPILDIRRIVTNTESGFKPRLPWWLIKGFQILTLATPQSWTYLALRGSKQTTKGVADFGLASREADSKILNNSSADFACRRLHAAGNWAAANLAGIIGAALSLAVASLVRSSQADPDPPRNLGVKDEEVLLMGYLICAGTFSLLAEAPQAGILETMIATVENPGRFSEKYGQIWNKMHDHFRPMAPFG